MMLCYTVMVSFVHFYDDFIKVFCAQVHARLGPSNPLNDYIRLDTVADN
jgi:hypothetical protein